MRLLQVVRARRRRHRARPVLHLRAARLREGGGLHAAVPGARVRGRDDRAAQLRRGHDPLRAADPAGGGRGRRDRPGHPRHAAPGAAAGRADGDQVLPRPVRRHRGAGHRRHPLVLDGEHVQPGSRPARVRHQGLPGRAVLALPGHRAQGRRPARPDRPVRGVHAARGPRRATWSSSAAAPGWRRSCRCCARWPSAGIEPQGDLLLRRADRARDLCFEDELRGAGGDAARTSGTCRRCPSPPTTTAGTARSG